MSSAAAAGGSQDWIRQYLDAWNSHDAARVVGFMTDDVRYADVALGESKSGAAEVQQFVESAEADFSSDYRFDAGQILVSTEDSYAVEWTMSGTNDRADEARGLPATGRHFEVAGVSIGRLRGGKIIENRDYWNLAGYLMQVGLMPAPEVATAG